MESNDRVRVVGRHLDEHGDGVQIRFDPNDQISKYLERMRMNKDKDAMEIMAGI